jgi:hypothetical protein
MNNDDYRRLILDPRCFKPAYEVNDDTVYTQALYAIRMALEVEHASSSEINVMEQMKQEVRKNRFTQ